jgi:hypothetical protein
MPRPIRVEIEESYYYLSNASPNGLRLFESTQDMDLFLTIVHKLEKLYSIQLITYCLTEQDYHLVVYANKANISQFMRQLGFLFSYETNRRRASKKEVFRSRYHSTLIEDEQSLRETIRYIHLKPLRLRLTEQPEAYSHSGYKELSGNRSEFHIDVAWALNKCGMNCLDVSAQLEDLQFSTIERKLSQRRRPPFLGSPLFIQSMRNHRQPQEQRLEIDPENFFGSFIPHRWDQILAPTTKEEMMFRRMIIRSLREHFSYRLEQISRLFHIKHISSLSRMLRLENYSRDEQIHWVDFSRIVEREKLRENHSAQPSQELA